MHSMIEYSSNHTNGTLKTGVVPDGMRDNEFRDAGTAACGVLLADQNTYTPVK